MLSFGILSDGFSRALFYLISIKATKQGLPVGFLLLQYSVLFTVDFLSLLYLLFIS